MKYSRLITALLALSAAACSVEEPSATGPERGPAREALVYHAVIEEENPSRTYFDALLHVRWNEDDRVTVFPDNTLGCEYAFQGGDGDPVGLLAPVQTGGDEGDAGTALDGYAYAVYPHSQDTRVSPDGAISYTFPDVQTYRADSFGRGANVMVAKAPATETDLTFRNVMGYLTFRLWGDDVHVSSVILKANGGEPLAGGGTIRIPDGIPEVTMDDPAPSDSIRLFCDDVLLGTSAEDCTEFWFALPPVDFTRADGGFTLTVTTTDGRVFERTARIDLSVRRRTVERMKPLEVVPVNTGVTPRLTRVSSTKSGVRYDAAQVGDTLMLTMPTVTDFSQLVIDFDMDGDRLMVGGKEVISGVTPIDATRPLSLVVRKGNVEKSFLFKARNTGLPVVRIETGDFFTLQDLERYQNALQSPDGVDHRVWLPEGKKDFVSIRIEEPDGTPGMKTSAGAPVYEIDTKVKGRGNFTWKWNKKPYALKFDKKTEVLGMPAHKRWILLANWRDRTLLRNDAAFWLSRQSGLPYTVRGRFVELEFNGEHRGNYYLCEQINIDRNRVNITKIDYGDLGLQNTEEHTGGYLMEIDSYFDEVNKFKSAEFNLNYMFKEPDEEELTPTDSLYMQRYVNALERILKTQSGVANHGYEDYLDVDSAILFMLLNELTGNRDFFQGQPNYGPHSTYLYKDQGGKLAMGPVWDFDYETFIPAEYYPRSGWGQSTYKWRGFDNTGYYYYYLCYDERFVKRVQSLWSTKKPAFEGLTDYIDEMARKIGLSQQFDEKKWPYRYETNRNDNHDYTLSFDRAIARMKDSFTSKVEWMDGKITGLTTTSPAFPYQ